MSQSQSWLDEATFAWNHTPQSELLDWGKDIALKLPEVFGRRITNFGELAVSISGALYEEFNQGIKAYRKEELEKHLGTRAKTIKANSVESLLKTYENLAALKAALVNNPKETVPELIVSILAFLTAAGGLDGDGGIPDLDLQFGIGAHRSIFTHSILAGAVLETLLYGLATFTGIVHKNLPEHHDAIWDVIHRNKDRFLEKIAQGASAGIAYHLLVDGTLQSAPYHDLPFSIPMEGHDAIILVNAGAEALDANRKGETFSEVSKAVFSAQKSGRSQSGSLEHVEINNVPLPTFSDQLQTIWIFWSAVALHWSYRHQYVILSDECKSRMRPTHITIIQKYGYWMRGIATGELFPLTDDQILFKAVALGEAPARNDFEHAWISYTQLTKA